MPRLDEWVGLLAMVAAGTSMFLDAAGLEAFLLATDDTGDAEADAAAEEGSEKEKLPKWLLELLLPLPWPWPRPPGLLPRLSS